MSAYAPQVLSAPLSCRCPQALACKSTGQMLRSRTSIAKNTRCSCKVLPPASVPQSREPPCTSFLNGSSPSSAKTSKPCGGALQGREGRGRQEAEPADLASAFEKNSRHSSAEGRFRASLESIRDSIRRRPWHRQGPLKVNPFPIPSAPLAPGPWPLAPGLSRDLLRQADLPVQGVGDHQVLALGPKGHCSAEQGIEEHASRKDVHRKIVLVASTQQALPDLQSLRKGIEKNCLQDSFLEEAPEQHIQVCQQLSAFHHRCHTQQLY